MTQDSMRAVRCFGFGRQHRLVSDQPVPAPGPGEVLARVDLAGVCAADRAMHDGTGPWELPFPFTPGHEFTATVAALGEGAGELHGLEEGDRTVAELNVSYGMDYFRQRGLYHLTDNMDVLGATRDGAWAEYMLYPAQTVIHKVSAGLSENAACYTEPLANAIHGVERAGIQFQDVVVIHGAGPIGMGMLQAARLKTPRKLILVDPGEAKRTVGLSLGADHAFHPDDTELAEAISDFTDGRGADVCLEASGQTSAFLRAMEVVRKRGTVVVFGVYKKPVEVDLNMFGEFKELNIFGGHLAPFTYETALDLMSRGLVDGDTCVTHRFPLEEFKEAMTRRPDPDELQIKVVLDPRI